jgi:cobalt/nickel transport protein
MNRRRWTNIAMVAVIVALVAVPLAVFGSSATFEGADAQGSTAIEEIDPQYTVWFHPFFEPASDEVESGLFALQAGLGGVVLGFVIGRLSGRRRGDTAPATAAGPAGGPAGGPEAVPVDPAP